ncbi:hypothetical protein SGLAM104S_06798 [Streptomyces glaucescens]
MDAFTAGLLQRIRATESDLTRSATRATTSSSRWSRVSSTTCAASPPNMAWKSARTASDRSTRYEAGPGESIAGARFVVVRRRTDSVVPGAQVLQEPLEGLEDARGSRDRQLA